MPKVKNDGRYTEPLSMVHVDRGWREVTHYCKPGAKRCLDGYEIPETARIGKPRQVDLLWGLPVDDCRRCAAVILAGGNPWKDRAIKDILAKSSQAPEDVTNG